MRVLIRRVGRRDGGALEYRDDELTTDEVTVGSSPDQDLVLMGEGVALRHVRIFRKRDGVFETVNIGPGELRINDRMSASFRIEVGDQIGIGTHRLRRIIAPSGFDFALELETG